MLLNLQDRITYRVQHRCLYGQAVPQTGGRGKDLISELDLKYSLFLLWYV